MSPKRLWNLLSEPRRVTFLLILTYLSIGAGGQSALTSPPAALLGEWGVNATHVWGWLLITCSVLGLGGAISGWYWVERAGAWAGFSAGLMLASALLYMHDKNPSHVWGVAGWVAMAAALLMLARIALTWGIAVDPARGPGLEGLRNYWRDALHSIFGGSKQRTLLTGG